MRTSNVLLIALITLVFLCLTGCPPSAPVDEPGPVGDADTSAAENGDSAPVTSFEDNDGTVIVTEDGETVVIGTDESTFQITEGIPDGWPDSVPIMDGFEVTEGGIASDPVTDNLSVTLLGDIPMLDAAEFYNNLPGWERNPDRELPPPSEEGFLGYFTADAVTELIVFGSLDEESRVIISLTYSVKKSQ